MVAVWDFTSFWQFDIIFCSVLDNHASVKLVMSILSIQLQEDAISQVYSGPCCLRSGDLPSPLMANFFYAPNFEEVEGAYWFGPVCPSVRLSVCLSVTLFGSSGTQEPLMLES